MVGLQLYGRSGIAAMGVGAGDIYLAPFLEADHANTTLVTHNGMEALG
jgi:hypothetical protein